MPCEFPPELDDRALLAYLDGEADRQVVAHLERCPHCRERATRLARLQSRLTSELYRLACPSTVELGEYHLGVLPPEQAEAVAQHVAECPHCSRELAQLEGYLAELAPALEPGPLERAGEQIRVLIARLLDRNSGRGPFGQPAVAPAYAGLRGDEEEPLIYQAEDVQVVIQIQQDVERPERKTILGLVVGLGENQELEAHLWQAGQRITVAAVDELGNFVMSDVVSGSYELILSGPEVEIHVQALEI
jgi:hypothetical protein